MDGTPTGVSASFSEDDRIRFIEVNGTDLQYGVFDAYCDLIATIFGGVRGLS